MTDQRDNMCEIEIGTLSEHEIGRLWSDFLMYKLIGAAFVFLMVTIASFSLLQFVYLLLGIKFLMPGNCVIISLLLSTLAILGGLPSVIREGQALKSECNSGVCEILTLKVGDAVEFETMMAQTGVALDCGEYTVLLLGGWWIEEDPPKFMWLGDRQSVPSTNCYLRILPRSGRVLSVSNEGESLKIRRPEGRLPRTRLELPLSADLVYANLKIDNVLVNVDALESSQ
jgi:hypothetical protein